MADQFQNQARPIDGPALGAFVITPSDTADLPQPIRAVTLYGAGKLAWQDTAGAAQATADLMPGTYPLFARRILETGTTATGLTGWI